MARYQRRSFLNDLILKGLQFDIFLSHVSEDKDGFVGPLTQKLAESGVRVWYDEKVGL